jgi:hypothetical protein
MSETSSASVALTGLQRWVNTWWPSARVRRDPLSEWRVADRYAAVSIAEWRLTPYMSRRLLGHRVPRSLNFSANERLTVVIPIRDREEHLRQLMPRLSATLDEQQISHRVLVVEQLMPGLFNKGRLLNAGLQYTAAGTDYFCLHDVDAVPVVANYLCPSQPLRLVNKIRRAGGDTYRSDRYFGGAISIRKEQVLAANGFSNEYWGWGKEDDDFLFRLLLAGFLCFYDTHGTFDDLPNPKQQQVVRKSPETPPYVRRNRQRRSRLLRGLMDPAEDGLSTQRWEVAERADSGSFERIGIRW